MHSCDYIGDLAAVNVLICSAGKNGGHCGQLDHDKPSRARIAFGGLSPCWRPPTSLQGRARDEEVATARGLPTARAKVPERRESREGRLPNGVRASDCRTGRTRSDCTAR